MTASGKRLAATILVIVSVLSLVGFAMADGIAFPDPALEAVIREQLGVPVGDIQDSDLETLDVLDASGLGIVDITGLAHCVNLEVLNLSENAIADISELVGLQNLTMLDLSDNPLEEIAPLAELTALTSLSLAYGRFNPDDLDEVLTHLVNLESLDVSGDRLTGMGNLPSLSKIERLILADNRIGSISGLRNCSRLSYLNLYKNNITDISALADLGALLFVDLHGNVIADFSPVQHVATVYRDTDADHDHLLDTWEVTHFGNLSKDGKGDSDNDGLSDLREYQRNTNPKDADTDTDGMADGWEVANGLNPLADDALDDKDGDGLSNLQEYMSGTDPGMWTLLLSLLGPEDGAVLPDKYGPTFVWQCSGEVRFKVEFASKADFSKNLLTLPARKNKWLSRSSFTPTSSQWKTIRTKGCAYWRVRVKAQGSGEHLSEVRTFTIQRARPNRFPFWW